MTDLNILDFEVDDTINLNGTSLQGTVQTSYDKLVEVLGEPTYTDADPYEKVNCEWNVDAKIEDQDDFFYKPFSVYCWKVGSIPTDKYDWHIGGDDYEAVEIAEKIING